jgi:hypothetical protein
VDRQNGAGGGEGGSNEVDGASRLRPCWFACVAAWLELDGTEAKAQKLRRALSRRLKAPAPRTEERRILLSEASLK